MVFNRRGKGMPDSFSCMLSITCFLIFIQHLKFNTKNLGNFLSTSFHDAILPCGLVLVILLFWASQEM